MRIATYQCEPRPLEVGQNLERLARVAEQAAGEGADLLLTPEMFLTGYVIGPDAVRRLAQPQDGDWAGRVGEIARAHGVAIVYGYPERPDDGEGGDGGRGDGGRGDGGRGDGVVPVAYNSVQLVGPDGVRLANYRKTHLYGPLDRSQFRPSDEGSAVVELGGWRFGMLICYDVEFPENARGLALAGVDVVLAPTANMVPYDVVATTLVPARAYENQVYVVYANYSGREADLEYCGLSSVVAPDGKDVARAGRGEELVVGALDRARLEESRREATYLLDRRPELYRAVSDGSLSGGSLSDASLSDSPLPDTPLSHAEAPADSGPDPRR